MTNSEDPHSGKVQVSNLDATINLISVVQSMDVECLPQELCNNNDDDDGSSDIREGNDKTLIHGDFSDNSDGIDCKEYIINEIRKVNEITPVKHKVTSELLLEPFRYISSIPGKNIREKLINCFQLWLNVEEKNILDEIKTIVGDLHNASLLIDDIEDDSKLRRGQPVAHDIFGVASVINSANYVYFLALEKCLLLKNTEAIGVFVKEMLNLHRGQGLEIIWRDKGQCPTEEEYCEMAMDKTGGLFRLAIGLMHCFASSSKDKDCMPLVNTMSLYFQIRDDLINLVDEDYFKSKSFCEDLSEGKFSFPIIHCVKKSGENDTRLLAILRQQTADEEIKRLALNIMKETGSFLYTRHKCCELKKTIEKEVEKLGGNQSLIKILEYLHLQVDRIE